MRISKPRCCECFRCQTKSTIYNVPSYNYLCYYVSPASVRIIARLCVKISKHFFDSINQKCFSGTATNLNNVQVIIKPSLVKVNVKYCSCPID